MNYKINKMDRSQARKYLSECASKYTKIIFSKHAIAELENDNLILADALNVLKSPDARIFTEGEFERGSYRYRVETSFLMVVISFNETGDTIIVVTAWDKRKRDI
jgi:hypothetical protein